MTLLRNASPEALHFTRWMARGLSALFIGFTLIFLVLNEDSRNSPTLPTIVFWFLALCLLLVSGPLPADRLAMGASRRATIVLFAIPLFIPIRKQIESPEGRPLPAAEDKPTARIMAIPEPNARVPRETMK
jgi:hypothetical protein